MGDVMLLETFFTVDLLLLLTKTIYTKVNNIDGVYEKILNEGLYHVTTKENAEAIMKSGYLKPSNGVSSLGKGKSFFFPGIPSYINLCINTANYANKYEMTAIKIRLNESELNSFKQRSFSDNAIIYEGKCIIPSDRTEIVSLVLDFDKDHNIIVREKGMDEVYQPSEELINELKLKEGYIYTVKNLLTGYVKEVKEFKNNVSKLVVYSYDKLSNKVKLVKDERHELIETKKKR
jgi:hypothetical protein